MLSLVELQYVASGSSLLLASYQVGVLFIYDILPVYWVWMFAPKCDVIWRHDSKCSIYVNALVYVYVVKLCNCIFGHLFKLTWDSQHVARSTSLDFYHFCGTNSNHTATTKRLWNSHIDALLCLSSGHINPTWSSQVCQRTTPSIFWRKREDGRRKRNVFYNVNNL